MSTFHFETLSTATSVDPKTTCSTWHFMPLPSMSLRATIKNLSINCAPKFPSRGFNCCVLLDMFVSNLDKSVLGRATLVWYEQRFWSSTTSVSLTLAWSTWRLANSSFSHPLIVPFLCLYIVIALVNKDSETSLFSLLLNKST